MRQVSTVEGPLKLLSVLVSSYNKQEFLHRSEVFLSEIVSLGAQVIIIEDSSTDGSIPIIGAWPSVLDGSIDYVVQENAGSAVSRNKAISLANGKYLLFVDIDDYVDVQTLCQVFPKLINSNADLGLTGYLQSPAMRIGPYPLAKFQNRTISIQDHRTDLLEGVGWWRYFYKRDQISRNNLRFLPSFEDMGGRIFVLDDLLWLLHIFSMDLTIYRADNSEVLYQYFLPDNASSSRREWYLNQVALMPAAIKIFLSDLENHKCIHDEPWLYAKCLDLLWNHANYLDIYNFISKIPEFLIVSVKIERKLGNYIFSKTTWRAIRTVLRLVVLKFRSIANSHPTSRP